MPKGTTIDVDTRPASTKVVIDGHTFDLGHIRQDGLRLQAESNGLTTVTVTFYVEQLRWVTYDGAVITQRPGEPFRIDKGEPE